MKIIVASPISVGSQKAHAINTVKHADGFAKLGHSVIIIFYSNKKGESQNWNEFYGIDSRIKWIKVPLTLFGKEMGLHKHFTMLVLPILFFLRPKLIFTRAYHLPAFISKMGFNVIAESHAHLDNFTDEFNYFIQSTKNKYFLKWITISEYLKRGYVERGALNQKIHVLPDAVDFDFFSNKGKSLLDPFENYTGKNVVYAGHLYDYKGIPSLLEAAKKLKGITIHLVGGLKEDIERHRYFCEKEKINNVVFHGMKKHQEVPNYLWNADLLLLTHSLNHPSANWTSPVKLAEYLASKKPVLVADIPALRDWLDNTSVFFYEPDNSNSLIQEINRVLSLEESEIQLKTTNAFQIAANWSYINRCSQILEGL